MQVLELPDSDRLPVEFSNVNIPSTRNARSLADARIPPFALRTCASRLIEDAELTNSDCQSILYNMKIDPSCPSCQGLRAASLGSHHPDRTEVVNGTRRRSEPEVAKARSCESTLGDPDAPSVDRAPNPGRNSLSKLSRLCQSYRAAYEGLGKYRPATP